MELHTPTVPVWTDPQQPPPPPHRAVRPSAAPLTEQHVEQLACAKLRAKKVRKACSVAMFNGCSLGVFAGCSLLMTLLGAMFGEYDIIGLAVGSALAIRSM